MPRCLTGGYFCASSSPDGRIILDELHLHLCFGRHETSSCSKYTCIFLQPFLVSSVACFHLPPKALYIKSSQAASPRAPYHMSSQTTMLRPLLVFTGLYLAASLPPGKTIHVRPFYPNVLTHINLERTRVQGWEVGEEWSRFGCCLIVVSRSPGRPFTTSFSSIMFWNTTTWHVRTTTTGNGCIAYAAARHIVRADTS